MRCEALAREFECERDGIIRPARRTSLPPGRAPRRGYHPSSSASSCGNHPCRGEGGVTNERKRDQDGEQGERGAFGSTMCSTNAEPTLSTSS